MGDLVVDGEGDVLNGKISEEEELECNLDFTEDENGKICIKIPSNLTPEGLKESLKKIEKGKKGTESGIMSLFILLLHHDVDKSFLEWIMTSFYVIVIGMLVNETTHGNDFMQVLLLLGLSSFRKAFINNFVHVFHIKFNTSL